MAGLSKISDHPLVSLMVSASQRLLGWPKVKKDPVTPQMLKALVESVTLWPYTATNSSSEQKRICILIPTSVQRRLRYKIPRTCINWHPIG